MRKNFLAILWLGWLSVAAHAQSSVFTYQGRLNLAGAPATGLYDLQFSLFDAPTVGTQNGITITNLAAPVTNGLFTTTLDFGDAVFNGSPRWLQIAVRGPGDTNYATLAPRQALTSTPYAVRAANYGGTLAATNLTGKINDTNLSANVPLLTNNVVFTRSVTASNFIGNGIGLTNLSATNLSGTLPDARLSTNVAFLNTNAYFKSTVLASNFVGNGVGLTNVPGRIFEVIPTGANIQALANFGYLATNDLSAVVVTLPATANIRVGETIRVAGSGAGGWVVAQNAGQFILIENLLDGVGLSWIPRDSSRSWKAVASSYDGKKLVAVVNGGHIFTSTNSGTTWTDGLGNPGNLNWQAVASSSDGTKLVAAASQGIWTSTDAGATWVGRLGAASWTGVAASADGVKLVAVINSGLIYTSANSGVNWSPQPLSGSRFWNSVASSANGQNLVATVSGGQVYTSTDSGVNWAGHDIGRTWISVASSTDGSRLVAAVNNGLLYTSTDSGTNWAAGGPGAAATWTGVASSADGSTLAAVVSPGSIYLSTDSGGTWNLRGGVSGLACTGVACSGAAETIVIAASSTLLYVSAQATTTTSGTAGYLTGTRLAAVELEYVGNGVFMPVSSLGTIRAQ